MYPQSLRILYRDEHLVAVYKPAGLLVHRSAIDRHETRFALQLARDLLGQPVYPVHRLDKPTAGVLLFALDAETARRLGNQFAGGAVVKRYVAVVRGHMPDAGSIAHPLAEAADRMTDALADPHKPAQPAITDYRCLDRTELAAAVGRYATARYSLIDARPHTGRKHQIRRHMKHVFHPIIGDTTHGDGKHNALFRDRFGCHRLLLAATAVQLRHPHSGIPLAIRAPLDDELLAILDALGWAPPAAP